MTSPSRPWSPDDDELLDLITRVVGPPPDWVVDRARIAWEWRDADRSIAELLDDSALTGTSRAAQTVQRTVAYAFGSITLELTIEEHGVLCSIGIVTVPTRSFALQISIVTPSGEAKTVEVLLDSNGGAALDVANNVRISLRAIVDGDRFATPWLTL